MEPTQPEVEPLKGIAQKSGWQSFWELVRFAIIALIVVIPIRLYIAEPFVVSGTSMVPTFQNGDYLIVDKISYELGSPQRDDVVVFEYPHDVYQSSPTHTGPKTYYIKRIIGLPGDTIDIKGNQITITNAAHPDGFQLDQPFVENTGNNDLHYVMGEGEYFVMGDNRAGSFDSRYWGPLPAKDIIGKPVLRLLPLSKIGFNPFSFKSLKNK